MNIEWTRQQRDRRDLFRRFGAEHVAPAASERDETRAFDHDSWKALAATGFWTAHIPQQYGGRGGDLWDFLAGLEGLALGADDSGFVLSAVAHAGLVHVLLDRGTPRQKRHLLGPLLSGAVGATAATEPSGGSHVAAIGTRARSVGAGRWQLSGHKTHITNAPVADLMLIVGRLDGIGDRDITLFVVDRDRPGLDTGAHEDLLGQRSSPTGSISLADVPIGAEDVLGAPGDGLATLYSFLAFDRLMYGIVVASQIEALLPRVVSRTTRRLAFGTAIGNHEFIQDKIVGMRMTVESSRFLAYAAADALLRGDDRCSALASCAKLAASEGAVSSAVELIQIFGHFGYERGNGLERHLRDAVAIRIAGGTTEMQKKNIYKDVARRYDPDNGLWDGGGVRTESGPPTPGTLRGADSLIVEVEDSAARWGNDGLHVLSTPSILGRMEQLCVATLESILEPGQMTVGVHVDLHHLAPTSVGDTVRYDVDMTRRGHGFDVEFTVTDSQGTTVSRGSHRRAVIDRDVFVAKLDGD